MNTTSDQTKRRLLAAVFALAALVALVFAIGRTHPNGTAATASQPTAVVVKLPGGGQRTVLVRPAHATTQTSPGGQTQLVSAVGPGGKTVLVPAAGGGDR
jgi:hypothetical protein